MILGMLSLRSNVENPICMGHARQRSISGDDARAFSSIMRGWLKRQPLILRISFIRQLKIGYYRIWRCLRDKYFENLKFIFLCLTLSFDGAVF